MSSENVIIKGVRDGMLILLDDSAPWGAVLSDLNARLEERSSFFRGASVTVNLGDRVIDEPDWNALYDLLKPYEIELNVVVAGSTQTRVIASAHGVRNRAPAFAQRGDVLAEAAAAAGFEPVAEPVGSSVGRNGRGDRNKRARGRVANVVVEQPVDVQHVPLNQDGEPDFLAVANTPEEQAGDYAPTEAPSFGWEQAPAGALFLRRTVRSGMSVHHDGDVCILGDVNAGAEIVAGGDILVWGVLRGLVHAGAGGDNAAVVGALLLAPTQLRIGDVLSRGPADAPANTRRPLPEMARIEGDRIVVEAWSFRRREKLA